MTQLYLKTCYLLNLFRFWKPNSTKNFWKLIKINFWFTIYYNKYWPFFLRNKKQRLYYLFWIWISCFNDLFYSFNSFSTFIISAYVITFLHFPTTYIVCTNNPWYYNSFNPTTRKSGCTCQIQTLYWRFKIRSFGIDRLIESINCAFRHRCISLERFWRCCILNDYMFA